MGLVIGYDPRTKAFVVKDSDKNVGVIADGKKVGFLGAGGTKQQTNAGTNSTTYNVTGNASVNLTTLNAALGAIQDKVNKISDVLKAFGLTT